MDSEFIYQPNTARITHEIIEGEVIIVDFDTGVYYSINPLGSIVFNWIVQGTNLDIVLSSLQQHYNNLAVDVSKGVDDFIQILLQEGILIRSDKTTEDDLVNARELRFEGLPDLASYEPPTLHKYTDMQDLLLLDPIHEVDEEGWPFTQQADENPTA